jgi:hypothetical protein
MCLSLILSALTALVGQEGSVHNVLGGQAGVGATAARGRGRQCAEGGRGFPFRDVLQLGILNLCCVGIGVYRGTAARNLPRTRPAPVLHPTLAPRPQPRRPLTSPGSTPLTRRQTFAAISRKPTVIVYLLTWYSHCPACYILLGAGSWPRW